PVGGGTRIVVYGLAHASSGVPEAWAAGVHPGVHRLADLGAGTADTLAGRMLAGRQAGDVVVASIHWGDNWGYRVPREQRAFAHRLIDSGSVDIVHGHSSQHPRGIARYRGKTILYGCGDFLNDYEGIGGHEAFRPWLSLMLFIAVDPGTGLTESLTMVPLAMRRLRLVRAALGREAPAGLGISSDSTRLARRPSMVNRDAERCSAP
ncbi:MAG: CapA family protein, partial [Deinococcales bacterium]